MPHYLSRPEARDQMSTSWEADERPDMSLAGKVEEINIYSSQAKRLRVLRSKRKRGSATKGWGEDSAPVGPNV